MAASFLPSIAARHLWHEMSAIDQICDELRELGFNPVKLHTTGNPTELATFEYPVQVGRYEGQRFHLGIAFQEPGYPEYPPHWICIANLPQGFNSNAAPIHSSIVHDGINWSMFSVPPLDFWDKLPSAEKNMRTYMHRHLYRFWSQL